MFLIEFVCAFVLVIVLCLFLGPLFISMGIVAHAGGRHIHNGSIPLVGGSAMILALAISEILIVKTDPFDMHFYALLFLSTIPVFLVSLLDDRYEVHPLMRLTVQAFSVLISMRVLGFEISYIGTNELQMPLGIWATPFTVVTGLFFINAFNMSDGIDGQCGSVAIIAFLFLALNAPPTVAHIATLIIAALLGFLCLNYPFSGQLSLRAKINATKVFMGDSGSATLGMLYFCLFILACQESMWESLNFFGGRAITELNFYECWYFAFLPLVDALHTVALRLIRRQNPLQGGLDHFHHALLYARFAPKEALLRSIFISIIFFILGSLVVTADLGGLFNGSVFLVSLILFSAYKAHLFHKTTT